MNNTNPHKHTTTGSSSTTTSARRGNAEGRQHHRHHTRRTVSSGSRGLGRRGEWRNASGATVSAAMSQYVNTNSLQNANLINTFGHHPSPRRGRNNNNSNNYYRDTNEDRNGGGAVEDERNDDDEEEAEELKIDSFGNIAYVSEYYRKNETSAAKKSKFPISDVPWQLRNEHSEVRENLCFYFSFLSTKRFWFLIQYAARITFIAILVPAAIIHAELPHTPFISGTFALSSVVIAAGTTVGQSALFFVQYIKAGCLWLPLATACAALRLDRYFGPWCVVYLALLFLLATYTVQTTRRMCLLLLNIALVNLLSGEESKAYPSRLLVDWLIGAAFALAAALLPYPLLATRNCRHISRKAFENTATCFSGILQCFWEPSNTARSMLMVRVRHLVRTVDEYEEQFNRFDTFTYYEVLFFESQEAREVRRQKMTLLTHLKMNLRSMERVINMVQDKPQMLNQSERCLLFQKHLSEPMNAICEATESLLFTIQKAKNYKALLSLSDDFENCGRAIKVLQDEFDTARRILFYENQNVLREIEEMNDRNNNNNNNNSSSSSSHCGSGSGSEGGSSSSSRSHYSSDKDDGEGADTSGYRSSSSVGTRRRRRHRHSHRHRHRRHHHHHRATPNAADESEAVPQRMEEFVPLMTFFVFSIVNFWTTLREFQVKVEKHDDTIGGFRSTLYVVWRGIIDPFIDNYEFTIRLFTKHAEADLRVVLEAAKVSIAMLISVLFFYYVNNQSLLLSGPSIIAFVSSTNAVEATQASAARLSGTLIGSVLGFFAASLCHNNVDLVISLCVITFVMTFFRTGSKIGPICMYCNFVAVSGLSPGAWDQTADQTLSRVQQNTFAIFIYCFISVTVFPVSPNRALLDKRLKVMQGTSAVISKLMSLLLEASACYEDAKQNYNVVPLSFNNAQPLSMEALHTLTDIEKPVDGAIGSPAHLGGAAGGSVSKDTATGVGDEARVDMSNNSNNMNNQSQLFPPAAERPDYITTDLLSHTDIKLASNTFTYRNRFNNMINNDNENAYYPDSTNNNNNNNNTTNAMPKAFTMAPEDTTIDQIFTQTFALLDLMASTTGIMPFASDEFTIVPPKREYPLRASGDVHAALYRLCGLVYTMACSWKTMRDKGYFTRDVIHIFHNLAPIARDISLCLERFVNVLCFYARRPSPGLSSELTKGLMKFKLLCVEFSRRKELDLLVVIRQTVLENRIVHKRPSKGSGRGGRSGRRSGRTNRRSSGGNGNGGGMPPASSPVPSTNMFTYNNDGSNGVTNETRVFDEQILNGGTNNNNNNNGAGLNRVFSAPAISMLRHGSTSNNLDNLTSSYADANSNARSGGGTPQSPLSPALSNSQSLTNNNNNNNYNNNDPGHERALKLRRDWRLRKQKMALLKLKQLKMKQRFAQSCPYGLSSMLNVTDEAAHGEPHHHHTNHHHHRDHHHHHQHQHQQQRHHRRSNKSGEELAALGGSNDEGGREGDPWAREATHSAPFGDEERESAVGNFTAAVAAISEPYGSVGGDLAAMGDTARGEDGAQTGKGKRSTREPKPRTGADEENYSLYHSSSANTSRSPSDDDDDEGSYSSSSSSSSRSGSRDGGRSGARNGGSPSRNVSSLIEFKESFTTPVTVLDAEGLHALTLALEMFAKELRRVLFGLEEMLQSY